MLMRTREEVDFHVVDERHEAIHARLVNWARYVRVGHGKPQQGPIWRLGKSGGRQWHEPVISTLVDTLDGHKLEKAVAMLPEKHREAIRWAYVNQWVLPHRIQRALGLTAEGLQRHIHDARLMLVNRRV